MRLRRLLIVMVGIALGGLGMSSQSRAQSVEDWPVHDPDRPNPPVVDPGPAPEAPAPVPSDATVLFGGEDLSAWESADGGPAQWKVEDGYMEVVPETGGIATKESFGDVQLHVEWASPEEVSGEGQERGNSGIFLMGTYEVQVLDSYQNETYADGQAAAIYGQHPPLVNASRPPGQWQTYDIIFRRPHFSADGSLEEPARITVFHNGVLVQDHVEPTGPTAYQERPPYEMHSDALPLTLQDHTNPVRYRNIWVRPLSDEGSGSEEDS